VKHYLLVIWKGVSADVEGPLPDDAAVLRLARKIRRQDDEHGVHRLDIDGFGCPSVSDFSGSEIEGD